MADGELANQRRFCFLGFRSKGKGVKAGNKPSRYYSCMEILEIFPA